MGCGGSKMEARAEAGAGLRAVHKKVEEIRRRMARARRPEEPHRKDSIVSTTGLLLPEEEDDDTATTTTDEYSSRQGTSPSCRHCGMPSPPREHSARDTPDLPSSTMTTPPPPEEEWKKDTDKELENQGKVEKEEKKEEGGNKAEEETGEAKVEKQEICKEEKELDDDKNKGLREDKGAVEEEDVKEQVDDDEGFDGAALNHRRLMVQEEEELPGSPSFRFFFQGEAARFQEEAPESGDDVDVDDSVNTGTTEAASRIAGAVVENPRRDDSSVDSSNSLESECKPSKKHRSKRFKVLTRGSSAVHGLFNVGSCYRHHHPNRRHSSDTSTCASHENPSTSTVHA